jgi:hypothetical protein
MTSTFYRSHKLSLLYVAFEETDNVLLETRVGLLHWRIWTETNSPRNFRCTSPVSNSTKPVMCFLNKTVVIWRRQRVKPNTHTMHVAESDKTSLSLKGLLKFYHTHMDLNKFLTSNLPLIKRTRIQLGLFMLWTETISEFPLCCFIERSTHIYELHGEFHAAAVFEPKNGALGQEAVWFSTQLLKWRRDKHISVPPDKYRGKVPLLNIKAIYYN